MAWARRQSKRKRQMHDQRPNKDQTERRKERTVGCAFPDRVDAKGIWVVGPLDATVVAWLAVEVRGVDAVKARAE